MSQSLSQYVLELACAIQQIPAPTFAEAQRAAFVEQCFINEGLTQVARDSVGNIYACIAARKSGAVSAKPLIVSAHLDTVFPISVDLALTHLADRIVGPGIGDNSLGVAALFSLARRIKHSPRDIWLVANVCEEGLGNLRGIKAVVEHFGQDALAYIVIEGMSLGQVYHAGLAVQRYKITVTTTGGHAWVDYGKPSAVHEIAELVVNLNQIRVSSQPRSSMNVGMIQGGTSVNTIASEASLELDLRSENAQGLNNLIFQVEEVVRKAQKETPHPVKARGEVIGQRPAGQIPADHPLVIQALTGLEELGLAACLNIGSTDANYPLSCGYPAVCIGITTGGRAHTPEEFINTKPVTFGLQALINLVERVCR